MQKLVKKKSKSHVQKIVPSDIGLWFSRTTQSVFCLRYRNKRDFLCLVKGNHGNPGTDSEKKSHKKHKRICRKWVMSLANVCCFFSCVWISHPCLSLSFCVWFSANWNKLKMFCVCPSRRRLRRFLLMLRRLLFRGGNPLIKLAKIMPRGKLQKLRSL